jgi:hypothetical protein
MRKILFLAANPIGTSRLRLDEEVRGIDEGLRLSQHRQDFELVQRWAVRPQDIRRALLDENPNIIHFSGHGEATGQLGRTRENSRDLGPVEGASDRTGHLIFEHSQGNPKPIDPTALANLFKLFAEQLECVVLNACYSQFQGEAIAQYVPYVVGTNQAIGDQAAIEFAVSFYDGLGAGRPIDFAFELGRNAIELAGLHESLTPVLLHGAPPTGPTVPTTVGVTQPDPALTVTAASQQGPAATATSHPSGALQVFISYSRKDEPLKEELEVHLSPLRRQGLIQPWQDRTIEAGTEWDAQIKAAMETADIILLLVSPYFIASDYINDVELKRAMERHREGSARVIPIILKPTDINGTTIATLQALPKDARPITSWRNPDEAFFDVAKGIRRTVETLRSSGRNTSDQDSQPSSPTAEPRPGLSSSVGQAVNSRSRGQLFQVLSSLPGPQFEQLLFMLNPPAGNMPGPSAPQASRVMALLSWAESPMGQGLGEVDNALSGIIGNPR